MNTIVNMNKYNYSSILDSIVAYSCPTQKYVRAFTYQLAAAHPEMWKGVDIDDAWCRGWSCGAEGEEASRMAWMRHLRFTLNHWRYSNVSPCPWTAARLSTSSVLVAPSRWIHHSRFVERRDWSRSRSRVWSRCWRSWSTAVVPLAQGRRCNIISTGKVVMGGGASSYFIGRCFFSYEQSEPISRCRSYQCGLWWVFSCPIHHSWPILPPEEHPLGIFGPMRNEIENPTAENVPKARSNGQEHTGREMPPFCPGYNIPNTWHT